jgi:hypothetical protein
LDVSLLRDAWSRSLDHFATVGIDAIVVDALDAEAKAFCQRIGFLPVSDDEMRLILHLSTIRAAASS